MSNPCRHSTVFSTAAICRHLLGAECSLHASHAETATRCRRGPGPAAGRPHDTKLPACLVLRAHRTQRRTGRASHRGSAPHPSPLNPPHTLLHSRKPTTRSYDASSLHCAVSSPCENVRASVRAGDCRPQPAALVRARAHHQVSDNERRHDDHRDTPALRPTCRHASFTRTVPTIQEAQTRMRKNQTRTHRAAATGHVLGVIVHIKS
jgi:hypothetical protein